MARILPLQSSFSAGELSPLMYGRVDTDGYQSGLAIMNNFIADARGPAVRRGGFRHLLRPGTSSNSGRLVTLPLSEALLFIIYLLDEVAIVATLSGAVPEQNFVVNPRFLDGDDNWTDYVSHAQSTVVYTPGAVILSPRQQGGPGDYAGVAQSVTVTVPGDEHELEVQSDGTQQYQVRVGNAPGDGSIFVGTSSQVKFTALFTPGVATFFVTVFALDTEVTGDVTIGYIGVTDQQASGLEFPTPWPQSALRNLHFIQEPNGNSIYVVHQNYPVYKFIYDPDTNDWQFEIVDFTQGGVNAAPPEWVGNNWPGAGTFFQGRLWLGGTPDEGETFWGSKSGFPEIFDPTADDSDGTLADDALQYSLERYGEIRWMLGTKNLLVGTVTGESIITSQDAIIVPGDIFVQQQSAYGSSRVQAIQLGDRVVYVSPDGRKVRAMQYEFAADNWLSKDLTFFSEHITRQGIRSLSWQQNPDNLLWCVLEDGTAASLTYERSNDIYGWHRHETNGRIVDMSTGNILGRSVNVIAVERVDGFIDLEFITQRTFLDSWIDRTYPEDTLTVDGLDHLEGQTVQVLVDGATHPDRVVGQNPDGSPGVVGEITLQYAGRNIDVGLQYISEMETLPFDKSSGADGMSAAMKRYNKIFVELIDSAKPIINGTRQPTRLPATPMNEPQPVITEVSLAVNLGWDFSALVNIKQDLPLDCRVISLFGEIALENY